MSNPKKHRAAPRQEALLGGRSQQKSPHTLSMGFRKRVKGSPHTPGWGVSTPFWVPEVIEACRCFFGLECFP